MFLFVLKEQVTSALSAYGIDRVTIWAYFCEGHTTSGLLGSK